MCFWLLFAMNSVPSLCIYSKPTNIVAGPQNLISYICLADDFFPFLGSDLRDTRWLEKKMQLIAFVRYRRMSYIKADIYLQYVKIVTLIFVLCLFVKSSVKPTNCVSWITFLNGFSRESECGLRSDRKQIQRLPDSFEIWWQHCLKL